MKKLSASAYTLIVLMAVMLVVIAVSLRFQYFATKMLPLLIASAVFVLAALQLGKEISTKGEPERTAAEDEDSIGEETRVEGRQYLPSLAWIVGFTLAIYLVGFIVAIVLFVLFYMKLHGSSWLAAVISAVLFTAIIYSVFALALGIDLYPGLLF
jgi:hypothetical protein